MKAATVPSSAPGDMPVGSAKGSLSSLVLKHEQHAALQKDALKEAECENWFVD